MVDAPVRSDLLPCGPRSSPRPISIPSRSGPCPARSISRPSARPIGGPLPDGPTDPPRSSTTWRAPWSPASSPAPGRATSASSSVAALPAALAADWLTSAWDQNAGLYVISPAAAVVEEVVAPGSSSCSVCRRATSVGFVDRRDDGQLHGACGRPSRRPRAGRLGRRARTGSSARRTSRSSPATSAHVTVFARSRCSASAAKRSTSDVVPADEQGRMRPEALRETLAGIDGPTIVCAQAGNVNTGAFDPLDALIADRRTSAAPGSTSTARSGSGRRPSRRCAHLRRVATKPPTPGRPTPTSGSTSRTTRGSSFVRDAAAHHAAMTLGASYYIETAGAERDNYNWAPESSRRARGFSVLAALRSLGRLRAGRPRRT